MIILAVGTHFSSHGLCERWPLSVKVKIKVNVHTKVAVVYRKVAFSVGVICLYACCPISYHAML